MQVESTDKDTMLGTAKGFTPIFLFRSLKYVAICLLLLVWDNDNYFGRRLSVTASLSDVDSNNFLSGGTDRKSMFYIYEWPSYMDDVWPPENATLHAKSGYDKGFRANRGAGNAIAPDVGLFQTWQFSLYRNLMARLRTSEFRTKDPTKATAFIVPFDLGE